MENNIIDNIKQEFKVFEDKKKLMVKELRKQFPEILKPLFEKSKIIDSIGWTQYTPYFNDGEECKFSVLINRDDLYINNVYVYDILNTKDSLSVKVTDENRQKCQEFCLKKGYKWIKNNVGDASYIENPEQDFELVKVIDDFHNILTNIPKEIFGDLFGDHVKVTIDKNGSIKVDEYSHD